MSQQYDNNLRGVLFKNDRKETDAHPYYKGQAEVDGVQYWVSGWIKEGQKGKFVSLSFTPKEDARATPANRGAQHRGGTTREERSRDIRDMDSDIPF